MKPLQDILNTVKADEQNQELILWALEIEARHNQLHNAAQAVVTLDRKLQSVPSEYMDYLAKCAEMPTGHWVEYPKMMKEKQDQLKVVVDSVLRPKQSTQHSPEMLDALKDAYLQMQIISNLNHLLAVHTDPIRAGLRNMIATVSGEDTQVVQEENETEAYQQTKMLLANKPYLNQIRYSSALLDMLDSIENDDGHIPHDLFATIRQTVLHAKGELE